TANAANHQKAFNLTQVTIGPFHQSRTEAAARSRFDAFDPPRGATGDSMIKG
ncbi:hypothetical protein QFZ56_008050, partial [Streptomyces achromogenes]|nr:hypothetical protein [Streptomyces achromogenes]